MMKKRQRSIGRDSKEERDRLSKLPDFVLLHIMNFMNTKHAIQTCVLSKRWKDLWKHLTNLTFNSSYFSTLGKFSRFVPWVLSSRDGSISLLNLDFKRSGWVEPKLLNRVIIYAMLHNVQQLTIDANLSFRTNFELPPSIFFCKSLTFLKLSIKCVASMKKLPKSLQLPKLKNLHLEYFTFTVNDNNCAEPFSACNMLNTLVIGGCSLHNDATVLCISNSNLSRLTILNTLEGGDCNIALATPNLVSLTIMGLSNHQLSSTCNLSFLEEVNIDVFQSTSFVTLSWLQVFPNVKTMTLSSNTLKSILNDLSNPGSVGTQLPCYVRLETLKVKLRSCASISSEEVNRIVDYLLHNSPLDTVDIINY